MNLSVERSYEKAGYFCYLFIAKFYKAFRSFSRSDFVIRVEQKVKVRIRIYKTNDFFHFLINFSKLNINKC